MTPVSGPDSFQSAGRAASHPIAVIGASTPGLLTALLLAREGREVSVYERTKHLDPPTRTLIVTGEMRDYIGALGEAAVVNEIKNFELFANGCVASVNLVRPDLIVERSALVRVLAKEADNTGVQIHLGHRFLGLQADEGSLKVTAMNGSQPQPRGFGTVIGADGAFSDVARSAGWGPRPTLSLLQAIVRLPDDLPHDTARVWFRPNDTRYFYWLIPESESYGALGVIGEEPGRLRARLNGFLAELGMLPIEYQAACVPDYRRWTPIHKKVGGGDVYLVGDAAGQVKVSTVGGVVTGFRGAIAAVDAIQGRRSATRLSKLRLELEAHRVLRRLLNGFEEPDYCALLGSLNDRARETLTRYSRDDGTNLLWRLPFTQPRLLVLALRGLFGTIRSR